MKKTVVQGPSILDWILGAKERVGVSEFPSDQYAPEDLAERVIPLSPEAKGLLLLKMSLKKELDEKHDAVTGVGDEAHDAFDLDLFGVPAMGIVDDLLSLQIRYDAQEAGIELDDDYLGCSFLSGDRVALVTGNDIVRHTLLETAAKLRKGG